MSSLQIQDVDPLPFHRILHGVLRKDDSLTEKDRSTGAVQWLSENLIGFKLVTSERERRLINLVIRHYSEFDYSPSRVALGDMVKQEQKPDSLLLLLEEYDRFVPQLPETAPLDLPQVFSERKVDWNRFETSEVLKQAITITNGSLQLDPRKPALAGTEAAMTYLFSKMQGGAIGEQFRQKGGSISSDVAGVEETYRRAKSERGLGRLLMPTGLAPIDEVLGGMKNKEFMGILGYAGSRKSSIARTIAYSAALQGYRVLHLPYEDDYDENRDAYSVMHAHHRKFFREMGGDMFKEFSINKKRLSDGNLAEAEEEFFFQTALADLEDSLKDNIRVIQTSDQSWGTLVRTLEIEDSKLPVDVLIVDYLSLVVPDDSSQRDQSKAVDGMIIKAKQLCLNFANGRGIRLITPVQGSRKGLEEAASREGRWDKSGIRQFSEFERSLDICLYVYFDDELQKEDLLKIGTCKSRRSADVPPTMVNCDPDSGIVSQQPRSAGRSTGGKDTADVEEFVVGGGTRGYV